MTNAHNLLRTAKCEAEGFAAEMRMEITMCDNDEERVLLAEAVGMAEGAANLLGRCQSLYAEYIEQMTKTAKQA